MIILAFACFLVLVAAWFMAANVEGEPAKSAAHAPATIEGKPAIEIA